EKLDRVVAVAAADRAVAIDDGEMVVQRVADDQAAVAGGVLGGGREGEVDDAVAARAAVGLLVEGEQIGAGVAVEDDAADVFVGGEEIVALAAVEGEVEDVVDVHTV